MMATSPGFRNDHLTEEGSDVLADASLDVPDVKPHPDNRPLQKPRRVEWKQVQLEFDEVEADGHAYAYDPISQDRFMLSPSALNELGLRNKKGQRFVALVTKAHLVTEVVR